MRDELVAAMWYDAENDKGQQTLKGTFVPPTDTPKYMTKVIDRVRIPQIVKNRVSISNTISTEEHIPGWKKKKNEQNRFTKNRILIISKPVVKITIAYNWTKSQDRFQLKKEFSPECYK